MLLEGKNAMIYGRGGAIGGGVAKTFASEGATVFLAGHTRGSLYEHAEESVRLDRMRMLRRSPRLAEVGAVAAFMASDRATAITGTCVNGSSGTFPS